MYLRFPTLDLLLIYLLEVDEVVLAFFLALLLKFVHQVVIVILQSLIVWRWVYLANLTLLIVSSLLIINSLGLKVLRQLSEDVFVEVLNDFLRDHLKLVIDFVHVFPEVFL